MPAMRAWLLVRRSGETRWPPLHLSASRRAKIPLDTTKCAPLQLPFHLLPCDTPRASLFVDSSRVQAAEHRQRPARAPANGRGRRAKVAPRCASRGGPAPPATSLDYAPTPGPSRPDKDQRRSPVQISFTASPRRLLFPLPLFASRAQPPPVLIHRLPSSHALARSPPGPRCADTICSDLAASSTNPASKAPVAPRLPLAHRSIATLG